MSGLARVRRPSRRDREHHGEHRDGAGLELAHAGAVPPHSGTDRVGRTGPRPLRLLVRGERARRSGDRPRADPDHRRARRLLRDPLAAPARATRLAHPCGTDDDRQFAPCRSERVPDPLPLRDGRRCGRRGVGDGGAAGRDSARRRVPHRELGARDDRPRALLCPLARRCHFDPVRQFLRQRRMDRRGLRLRGARRLDRAPSVPGRHERGTGRARCRPSGARDRGDLRVEHGAGGRPLPGRAGRALRRPDRPVVRARTFPRRCRRLRAGQLRPRVRSDTRHSHRRIDGLPGDGGLRLVTDVRELPARHRAQRARASGRRRARVGMRGRGRGRLRPGHRPQLAGAQLGRQLGAARRRPGQPSRFPADLGTAPRPPGHRRRGDPRRGDPPVRHRTALRGRARHRRVCAGRQEPATPAYWGRGQRHCCAGCANGSRGRRRRARAGSRPRLRRRGSAAPRRRSRARRPRCRRSPRAHRCPRPPIRSTTSGR